MDKGRLNMPKKFKISIRISIIAIFVFLLGIISFAITLIHYVTLNKVLATGAQNVIEETSLLVKERVQLYLRPLSRDLMVIRSTINRGIVSLNNLKQFDRFLIERLRYNPDIYMIYYSTMAGDYYGVDHEQSQKIGLTHIIHSQKSVQAIRYEFDEEGRVSIKEQKLNVQYDPRQRPWFQDAIKAKKPIWTDVYTFYPFTQKAEKLQGITAAVPIYDAEKKIQGVLGLDLTITGIQHFIKTLQVTQNAMIYIIDDQEQVIVSRKAQSKTFDDALLMLKKSHITAQQSNTLPVKTFRYRNAEYFLSYQAIPNTITSKPWHILIIVPADDVLAPLKTLSMHAIILTSSLLFLGLLIAGFISKKISNPIIQLAKEAQEITQLNLTIPPKLETMIKEISYMDDSLANMRKSLMSFQRYTPRSLVKNLMSKGEIAQVGGKNQEITILFSDIKNFTSLCEETNPQLLMHYLSDYFQSMTESVINHAGTLDKYIGDSVMAFWNAPIKDNDHALHACQTALDMQKRVEQFNQRNRESGLAECIIRIGINSGDAIIGNVGSEDRLNFTALGDAVNLASRLESINKIYHSQIIVSAATYQKVSHQFSFRLLDEVAVQGKKQGTTIYELLTKADLLDLEHYKKAFQAAFSLYQKGKWRESLALFQQLKPLFSGDYLATLYVKRCQELIDAPLSFWDGVWRID